MYMYMYVYVHMYMYVYMYVYMDVYMDVCIYVYHLHKVTCETTRELAIMLRFLARHLRHIDSAQDLGGTGKRSGSSSMRSSGRSPICRWLSRSVEMLEYYKNIFLGSRFLPLSL